MVMFAWYIDLGYVHFKNYFQIVWKNAHCEHNLLKFFTKLFAWYLKLHRHFRLRGKLYFFLLILNFKRSQISTRAALLWKTCRVPFFRHNNDGNSKGDGDDDDDNENNVRMQQVREYFWNERISQRMLTVSLKSW